MKERPVLFNGHMVRAILTGAKTQTRRPLHVQPPPLDHTARWMFCLESTDRCAQGSWELGVLDHNGYVYTERGPERIVARVRSPHGVPGDRLWVRETWADANSEDGPCIVYRADGARITWHEWCVEKVPDYGAGPSMNYERYPGDYCMWWEDLLRGEPDHNWKPSIHMPRWASRIDLDVLSSRPERLQDISEADILAEGITVPLVAEITAIPWREIPTLHDAFRLVWDGIYPPGKRWADNPWVWATAFCRVDA